MTSSLLTDVVTSQHHSNAGLSRCFGVSRRHRKDVTIAPVECMNCDDVSKRRTAAHPGSSSRRKQKQRPRHSELDVNNPSNNNAENDEADETGSVCSSVSSTSGSSSGSLRSRKLRCPVHGQRRRRKDNVDETMTDMSSDKLLTVCSCRPIAVVTRPEPEGGPQTAMDEFERLIYGPSNPLFSDSESVTVDVIVDDVEQPVVRFEKHRTANHRGGNDASDFTESLFSAAQMINTNTFMKMAIIQNELKNVKDVSIRRAENDVAMMCRRADAVKESCALSEQSLKGTNLLLKDTIAAFKSIAEKSQGRSFQHLQQIPQPSGESSSQGVRTHVTSSTVRRRLVTTDVDIELANNSLDLAEVKVNELEEELKSLVGAMGRSTSDRKEKAIRDVTLRLKEAEHRAMLAEQKIHSLQLETETGELCQTINSAVFHPNGKNRRRALFDGWKVCPVQRPDDALSPLPQHCYCLLIKVTPSLKKHQQIGSGSCSFTLADLIEY